MPPRAHAGREWRIRENPKSWRRGSESNRRVKVLQTSPLPLGYRAPKNSGKCFAASGKLEGKFPILISPLSTCHFPLVPESFGAGNGIRTRDFDLGKVALYH